jgi:hypothetical protein
VLSQHLGQSEDEVGGRRPGRQRAAKPDTDDDRRRQVRGLTEHRRLSLDSTHTPAEHPEAVDHRGVGVGPHQRVRDRNRAPSELANLHHLGDVFEVDLVADAHTGRNKREVVERLSGPAKQRVTLVVALDLFLDVPRVGISKSK